MPRVDGDADPGPQETRIAAIRAAVQAEATPSRRALYVERIGKGISYRDPVSYNLAIAAVALADNQQAKAVLADCGYTEVSDAALETIRRNKPAVATSAANAPGGAPTQRVGRRARHA